MSKKNLTKLIAFTLTETLVMAAVIGIIAVISSTSLKGARPDRDAMMVRKAFSEISNAVNALSNDEDYYPSARLYENAILFNNRYYVAENTPKNSIGSVINSFFIGKCFAGEFDNITKRTGSVPSEYFTEGSFSDYRYLQAGDGVSVFSDTNVYNGGSYIPGNKFGYAMGKTLKSDNLSCNGRVCTFKTADGMSWKIQDHMNDEGCAYINVDINGTKGSGSMTNSNPDVFPFKVTKNGDIFVGGKDLSNGSDVSTSTSAVVKAKAYLQSRDIRAKS